MKVGVVVYPSKLGGSIGRSNVTVKLTEPLRRIGVRDWAHRAINDPRPVGNNHRLIEDGQERALNGAIDDMALVQVSGPDRVNLTVEDSQPHLVAIAKETVRVTVAARLVVRARDR